MTCQRLGIVRDFRAEDSRSMDLCADQLLANWPAGAEMAAVDVETDFKRCVGSIPSIGKRRAAFNADRLLNRHWFLPRFVRRRVGEIELFHVVDHSYAQLVHQLPADRTGVYCHDVDAFRCLIEPDRERRPFWFRMMTRRILTGLQKAAVVFHSTLAVRKELLDNRLVPEGRLVHAPYGVSEEFTPAPRGEPPRWLPDDRSPWILHVGSCIPRKRIDVLLRTTAELAKRLPGLKLLKVGGTFSDAQTELKRSLGIEDRVVHVTDATNDNVAHAYRTAPLVLLPSEAEGFGLPVIEALACGAPVLANDLPVLREVGADAASYHSINDLAGWCDAARRLLTDPGAAPPREARLARASQFTWRRHAEIIREAYRRILAGQPPCG